MPVQVNDVVRITIRGTHSDSGVVELVHHLKCGPTWTSIPSDLTFMQLVEAMLASKYTTANSYTMSHVVWSDLLGYNITQDIPLPGVSCSGAWNSGHATQDPVATAASFLCTWKTGYPKSTGKKFIPGFYETIMTSGLWTGTVVTNMLAFAQGFLGTSVLAVGTNDVTFGTWNIAGSAFRQFISTLVSAIPAYQRRRKSGVGI